MSIKRELPEKEIDKETFLFDLSFIITVLQNTLFLPKFRQTSTYHVEAPSTLAFWVFSVMRVILAQLLIFITYMYPFMYDDAYFESVVQLVYARSEASLFAIIFATCLYLIARNENQLIEIFNLLLTIDKEFKQLYYEGPAKTVTKYGLKIIFLSIWLIALIDMFVHSQKFIDILVKDILITYVTIFYSYITFLAIMLRAISKRFLFLNEILVGYTMQPQTKLFTKKQWLDSQEIVGIFKEDALFVFRMHNQLTRILKNTNEYCSLILVLWMGFTFFGTTTMLYDILTSVSGFKTTFALILQIFYLLIYVSVLSFLCLNCGKACDEANRTARILSKIYVKNKEDKDLIDKYLTKNIKQKIEFTAYGFFVINKSTLFKIFSAVTTYLVILVQFKQLEETKENFMELS